MELIKLLIGSLACLTISLKLINAAPQNGVKSVADINLNTVLPPDSKNKVTPGSSLIAQNPNGPNIAVIQDGTTVRTLSPTPTTDLQYPKPIDTSMIANFFRNIFQIPISVLEAVSNLLAGPFRQHQNPPTVTVQTQQR